MQLETGRSPGSDMNCFLFSSDTGLPLVSNWREKEREGGREGRRGEGGREGGKEGRGREGGREGRRGEGGKE